MNDQLFRPMIMSHRGNQTNMNEIFLDRFPLSPNRTHLGPHVCSHFLGEIGTFRAFVSGRFPEKARIIFLFVLTNKQTKNKLVTDSRGRGFR